MNKQEIDKEIMQPKKEEEMNKYKEKLRRQEERQQRDNEMNEWKDKRMKELFHGIIGSLEDVRPTQTRQIKKALRHEHWNLHNEDKKGDNIKYKRKQNKKRSTKKKGRDTKIQRRKPEEAKEMAKQE